MVRLSDRLPAGTGTCQAVYSCGTPARVVETDRSRLISLVLPYHRRAPSFPNYRLLGHSIRYGLQLRHDSRKRLRVSTQAVPRL